MREIMHSQNECEVRPYYSKLESYGKCGKLERPGMSLTDPKPSQTSNGFFLTAFNR